MDSKTFISNKILDFAKKFDEYSYKYWIDDACDNHFIEIIPSTYKISGKFIDEEVDLLEEFYSIYFNDSLSFVTSEEIKSLGELHLVKSVEAVCPWVYNSINIVASNILKDIKVDPWHGIEQDYNYALAA